jgi:acetyl-CoA C-acetyltransferase
MSDAVIVSAARTPIGTFNGAFASVSAVDLGAVVIREALARAGVSGDRVDDVIMGNVLAAGLGQNPTRQAALRAGVSEATPATGINQLCGSGLRAVAFATQQVLLGDAEVVVAGGTENMTRAPYLLEEARQGYRLGHAQLYDSMLRDGLWCAMSDVHMGVTAENIAREVGVSRADQDAFALASQEKAGRAIAEGRFADEIVAVDVPQRRGPARRVAADEYPRPETTFEALATLRPAFEPDGTVTAGNASGINDGAAAVVVMSRSAAEAAGLVPLAAVRSWASVGVAPRIMGMGPVKAIPAALAKAGLELGDIGVIELNEAFAAQGLAVVRTLGMDLEKVNPNGGAIALGHPLGCTGAKLTTQIVYEMKRRKVRYGLVTMCIGGGMGAAGVFENLTL